MARRQIGYYSRLLTYGEQEGMRTFICQAFDRQREILEISVSAKEHGQGVRTVTILYTQLPGMLWSSSKIVALPQGLDFGR